MGIESLYVRTRFIYDAFCCICETVYLNIVSHCNHKTRYNLPMNEENKTLEDVIFNANLGPEIVIRGMIALTLMRRTLSTLLAKNLLSDAEIKDIVDGTRQSMSDYANDVLKRAETDFEKEVGTRMLEENEQNCSKLESLILG